MFGLLVFASFMITMVASQSSKVMIFSATEGFRHSSIPVAITQLQLHGPEYGVQFDNTEDPASFNATNLNQYDAVLFLMVTDDPKSPILSQPQRDAFEAYLNNGGNFVGVHAASYCLQTSQFYQAELGAYFLGHPALAPATFLNNLEPDHPTVNMLPAEWNFREEVYDFQTDPRKFGAKVVLTIAQNDNADNHGTPHPIAWYQNRGAGVKEGAQFAGRSFYTSLGHMNSTWKEPLFMGHIMGGVTWVMDANTTLAYNNQAIVGNAAGFGAPRKRPSSSPSSSLTSSAPEATDSPSVKSTDNNNNNAGQQSFSPAWTAGFLAIVAGLLFIHGY